EQMQGCAFGSGVEPDGAYRADAVRSDDWSPDRSLDIGGVGKVLPADSEASADLHFRTTVAWQARHFSMTGARSPAAMRSVRQGSTSGPSAPGGTRKRPLQNHSGTRLPPRAGLQSSVEENQGARHMLCLCGC